MCLEFADALAAFRAGDRELAGERFGGVAGNFPNDGPSAFYASLLRHGIPTGGVIDAWGRTGSSICAFPSL